MRLSKVILTLALSLAVVYAMAENNYKVISSSSLNVRKTPSALGKVLGTFESGQQIEVLDVKKDWAKVKYNGKKGYVLMEYIQPLSSPVVATPSSIEYEQIQNNENSFTNPVLDPADDTFDSERKDYMIEIGFAASTFKDVKTSGYYGVSMTVLPIEIAPRLYAGLHWSPFYANYGLVDSAFASQMLMLGPALGYYFTPKVFIAAPLDIMCAYFFINSNLKTSWGMSWAPSLYIGNKSGVFIGPQFSIGFKGDSKVYCGFRTGIYF